ncbi:Por secretion system C-terminal sorting domain-containing protein [Pseudarcicella hirudinis]|uniref:Por secretion system C-terminal sorting domain-containing protein n=1 Tax=Pseudarcicella hirudinis TaxID=1079859 RepID=A0A1I5VCM9_9BACT|nr:S8 family serine peptidase [Pseudarcicella hirudinis]SFQ05314.1 Por secretion system C-terminal sorting domain-containing protein [Pseudarcicella hirudinis]
MRKNNIHVKIKLSVLCFMFSSVISIAQISPQYVNGEVYLKIRDNSTISLGTTTSVSLSSVSFLNALSQTFKIQNITRSFYNGDVKTGITSANSQVAAAALRISKIVRIKLANPNQTDAFIALAKTYADVEYVEKVQMFSTGVTPNDIGANSQTGTGQWALYKVNAMQAWGITIGNPSVIVAVVDNAIDTSHLDLVNNVVGGRDVADGDNNTIPSNTAMNHGTHVAGIVGAQTNNSFGIASIGYNIKVMPVKTAKDTDGTTTISFGYEGITWAAQNGAKVINCSWRAPTSIADGGSVDSSYPTQRDVINFAIQNGCVLVVAAGNDNTSNLTIPAGFTNVISVASTGFTDVKSSFSNYGSWIDISAPGESIYSTLPSNSYASWDGTSMASPLVAGIVGLMYSINPNLTRDQCETCLRNSALNIDANNSGFAGKLGSGRVDAHGAVLCAQNLRCPSTLTLTTSINSGTQLFQSSSNIFSTSQISGNTTNITYKAGNQIKLQQGFKVSNQAVFKAYLAGCSAARMASENAEITEFKSDEISILSASPNPVVNGEFIISYSVTTDGLASISLANVMGEHIKTIVPEKYHEKGTYKVSVNATDLRNGLYLYTLRGDNVFQSKKILIQH